MMAIECDLVERQPAVVGAQSRGIHVNELIIALRSRRASSRRADDVVLYSTALHGLAAHADHVVLSARD